MKALLEIFNIVLATVSGGGGESWSNCGTGIG